MHRKNISLPLAFRKLPKKIVYQHGHLMPSANQCHLKRKNRFESSQILTIDPNKMQLQYLRRTKQRQIPSFEQTPLRLTASLPGLSLHSTFHPFSWWPNPILSGQWHCKPWHFWHVPSSIKPKCGSHRLPYPLFTGSWENHRLKKCQLGGKGFTVYRFDHSSNIITHGILKNDVP